jgi:hypothetical protein
MDFTKITKDHIKNVWMLGDKEVWVCPPLANLEIEQSKKPNALFVTLQEFLDNLNHFQSLNV